MFASKPKKIILFGMVKGYVIWLVLWVILMLCVRANYVLLFVIAFLIGMGIGLLAQAVSDAGKTAEINGNGISYGRDNKKTIPLDADISMLSFVSFAPTLPTIRIQMLIVSDGDVQKIVSFNWLSKEDYTKMCEQIKAS